MTIAAMSRVSRSRFPLAESSICSACVGAVEAHRVGAALAVVRVAAVAGVPHERVVAAAADQRGVVAAVAVDGVVAVAAVERLRAGAAEQRVVAVLAVERRRDRVGEDPAALVDAHGVVAVPGLDVDRVHVGAGEAELGRAVVAEVDLDRAGLARLQADRDLVVGLGALDRQHPVLDLRGLGRLRGLAVSAGLAWPAAMPATATAATAASAVSVGACRTARDPLRVLRWFIGNPLGKSVS